MSDTDHTLTIGQEVSNPLIDLHNCPHQCDARITICNRHNKEMRTYSIDFIQKGDETQITTANIPFTGFLQMLNSCFINFTPPFIFYERILPPGHPYAGKREMTQLDTSGNEHENQITLRNALQHQWDHMPTRNYKFYVQYSDEVPPKMPENGVQEWKAAIRKVKEDMRGEGAPASRRR